MTKHIWSQSMSLSYIIKFFFLSFIMWSIRNYQTWFLPFTKQCQKIAITTKRRKISTTIHKKLSTSLCLCQTKQKIHWIYFVLIDVGRKKRWFIGKALRHHDIITWPQKNKSRMFICLKFKFRSQLSFITYLILIILSTPEWFL